MDGPVDGLEKLTVHIHREGEQTLRVCGLYNLFAM